VLFFFSSRRRHTRFSRDWSSDVCSSDLGAYFYCPDLILKKAGELSEKKLAIILNEKDLKAESLEDLLQPCQGIISLVRIAITPRSEERRVGKESSSRWAAHRANKSIARC